ncbi:MAG: four helix bundle protein, partial [Myxococcales bacterium]|nr:four helix bundle protein [Myxococcales bacterium]
MLRIYSFVLELVARLRTLIGVIERKDRDLGRQLRRCTASVGLNLAEGQYSRGKNRAARYHNALGSAREMVACFEMAAPSATFLPSRPSSRQTSTASSVRSCGSSNAPARVAGARCVTVDTSPRASHRGHKSEQGARELQATRSRRRPGVVARRNSFGFERISATGRPC